jgi:transposase InsO family protein
LNRKRTQRLWREEGLRVPQRRRKRQRLGESTVPASRLTAERPNQVWALDFQYDQTADGRILKRSFGLTPPARPDGTSARSSLSTLIHSRIRVLAISRHWPTRNSTRSTGSTGRW